MSPELKRLIEQTSRDKGIDKEVIIEVLETAMLTAARKKLGMDVDVEAGYNEDAGEIEVFQFKTVVEKSLDHDTQISLKDARRDMDEDAELGDSLGVKVEAATFGRIAVQTAKQILMQKVKDAERDKIYEEYKDRKGELLTGFVHRFERGSIIVNLGRAEGMVPLDEQIFRESYKRGERIRAYICDVRRISKGPQIILSRTHPGFIRRLFEVEVPEISEGLIEIVNISRDPGNRTKISVRTNDRDIDPVGACVGMRGSRVQSVAQELRGEKIDIVSYSDDQVEYICNALSPAKVERVTMDEDAKSMEVVVPDDQLSLAIGRNGQNVKLAVKLTGWNIDVKSESLKAERIEKGYESLMQIPGVGGVIAERLFKEGFENVEAIASAGADTLSSIPGIGKKTASTWIERAKEIVDERDKNEVS
jgi:transcription termination factor NusA